MAEIDTTGISGMDKYDFDLITIGGGSGGVRASRVAAELGARVAVIERAQLGGTCVNVGCIPKKILSFAAHYGEDLEEAARFGWTTGPRNFDWQTLLANKDAEITRLNGVYRRVLEQAGVTIIEGQARVVDGHTVDVAGRRLTAAHILVATGGRPAMPDFPGAEFAFDSDAMFHLPSLPASMVVHGAGYIAVEFASILNGLGVETILVYRGERLLKGFDADLGTLLADEMREKGVRLLPSTTVTRLSKSAGGELTVELSNGEHLATGGFLAALGRVPNVAGLGLQEAGVVLSPSGAVVVNDEYRTSVPSIFAIGDVINRIQLTPVALAEGMFVANHLFGGTSHTVPYGTVATAVFSQPNIGTVGLSEESALQVVPSVTVYKTTFRSLRNVIAARQEKTFMKVLVDTETDRVIGMHMLGPEAGEIIQGFAAAITAGITKRQLDATIGIHPTLAEEFVTLRKASAVLTGIAARSAVTTSAK